ncbi:MAG TPA: flagellar brake protein [Dissulfurispiraceae bacterium]|nr:flagellar brake protein [Dissulfurispiraceae bacterium]
MKTSNKFRSDFYLYEMSEDILQQGQQLLLQLPKLDRRVGLYVIGWHKDQFVITNLPYVDEKPLKLKTEDNYIIRFLKGDDAYGFQTSIISVQFFPAPLIFFRYPVHVDKIPFRKSRRFRLNIPAKLLNPADVQTYDAEVSDISETGCRIKLAEMDEDFFSVGSRLFLTFHILEKGVEADCILRNARKIDSSLYLGLEFASISQSYRDAIISFIDMLSKAISAP